MSFVVLTYDDEEYEGYGLTDKIRHDVMCVAYSDSSLEDAQYMMRIMQALDALEREHREALGEIERLNNLNDSYKSRIKNLERRTEYLERVRDERDGRIDGLKREIYEKNLRIEVLEHIAGLSKDDCEE